MRCDRCWSNQASRKSLVGRGGGGGIAKTLSSGSKMGQSVRNQLGEGVGGDENRGESVI